MLEMPRLTRRVLVPNDGCLNFVDENDEVLISGFGRSGKAKGDIPGVRFKVVKVSGVGLLALWKEKKVNCLPTMLCPATDAPFFTGKAKVVNYIRQLISPPASSFAVLLYARASHYAAIVMKTIWNVRYP